ncbi:hybrid sensor histidine kinase/response regulator [Congregibacter variabilis]|uniref:histidine kinase n=1 Tax=Congregibacter variabilis TaxID=3081200 RepID=A0ABZ0I697_9GAMM|nr:hybrid sensor histidine kinase/response regulator [Congregibacter sp. IMCC43200]
MPVDDYWDLLCEHLADIDAAFRLLISPLTKNQGSLSLWSPNNWNSMQTPGTEPALEDKLRIEQVKTLFESMYPLMSINLIVSACLVFGFWDIIDHPVLLAWFGLMLGMLLLRGILYINYQNRFDPEQAGQYSFFLVAGSAIAGMIWGASGILLFPAGQLDYQLFILMALFGMTGGSTFTLSIYLPTYYAFSPLVLTPITVKLLSTGETIHLTMAAVTIVFLAALTFFNIKINRSFKNTLQLRFTNLDLIEKLQEQKDEAERANSAKSKFLAAASHDLRQPLYALNLFAAVLDESVTNEKTRKTVLQIKSSVDALQDQFDTLLDISQLDAGTVLAEKKELFLGDIVNRLANTYTLQAQKKGLTLSFENCNYIINSDVNLIERILGNYLSNAIRYTTTGTITMRCIEKDGALIIDVADTGKGIPAESIEDIFEEFEQLDNNERDRQKGFGLGLSIVKRAARLLDHKIHVESEVGRGSVFSIIIDGEHTRSVSDIIVTESGAACTGKQPLVVIIDDEASIREGIADLLDIWGYKTICSANGDQAMEQLKTGMHKPDAIISDFRLKNDETGIDVIRRLHTAFQSDIPALIVTGDIDNERLLALAQSGHIVLHKPVAPSKLRAFLHSTHTTENSRNIIGPETFFEPPRRPGFDC